MNQQDLRRFFAGQNIDAIFPAFERRFTCVVQTGICFSRFSGRDGGDPIIFQDRPDIAAEINYASSPQRAISRDISLRRAKPHTYREKNQQGKASLGLAYRIIIFGTPFQYPSPKNG